MPVKVILDGSLFSECERMGANRYGMLRLAESITKELIADKTLDISFANTFYTGDYDELLHKYLAANYPEYSAKILSEKPFFQTGIPKLRGLLRRIAEYGKFQTAIRSLNENDLFHSFYYAVSPNIQNAGIKKSLTYLDIIALKIPGYDAVLIDLTKSIVESIVSNFAISISEFSKQDLIDYDKRIDPERVFISPPAASEELFFQNKNPEEWQRIKRKYNLPDNYFLSISSRDRRKNVPHLVKSFAKYVLQQKPDDLFLVLSGNFNYSRTLLDELQIDKAVRNRIVITETHIEDQDLSVVYSNSLCFFFMSYYEGFGLPALEAMQCGTPVVTADSTSLPEVVGDAGIMLNPYDEDALCEAMNKMYSDGDLRKKYSSLGLERSKKFSWQRCAEEYAEIFKIITSSF